jgi:hypothetical protein
VAHFQRPPNGLLGEYEADNRLAVGSLWRMSIPLGGTGAEVALWGGNGLEVRSNNENVVQNPLPVRTDGDLRIFTLKGLQLNGTTLIEFGRGSFQENQWQWGAGSPWPGWLQVRVTSTAKVRAATDDLITLDKPHMALNAADTPYSYQMQYNPSIQRHTSARQIIDAVNAVGKLKHLVFACHGYIEYKNNEIENSRIELGSGFSETALFSQFKNLAGSVVWLAACVIGNDNERNKQRAINGRCYVVAPVMEMSLKPGLIKGRILPFGKLDMFARFSPKVFSPAGEIIDFRSFLKMGRQIGFSV